MLPAVLAAMLSKISGYVFLVAFLDLTVHNVQWHSCEQKTKDCALHGHQGASNINYSTIVSTLMFAGFHNQSPLLTMV